MSKIFLSGIKKKIYKSKCLEIFYRKYLRIRLNNKDFTIICNNCWAGSVYEDLGLPYSTPTVGLFFYAPCYIKFISNLKHYLQQPLTFKDTSVYPLANERRMRKKYPLGILDDIEIHFLHYKCDEEALDKWNRRTERMNFDNLFVAFSDVDLCTLKEIRNFDTMSNFKHKVFFSAKNHPGIESLIWLKSYQNHDHVGDIVNNRWAYRKYFDVVKWLNAQ